MEIGNDTAVAKVVRYWDLVDDPRHGRRPGTNDASGSRTILHPGWDDRSAQPGAGGRVALGTAGAVREMRGLRPCDPSGGALEMLLRPSAPATPAHLSTLLPLPEGIPVGDVSEL